MDASNADAMAGVAERSRRRRPWLPACLAAHDLTVDDVQQLCYIVVEEIVEDAATLGLTPWPAADGHGRLRFDVAGVSDIAVGLRRLHTEVYLGWLGRRPRIGDVLAARIDHAAVRRSGGLWDRPLRELLSGPVYDMSKEARLVAKLALYAVRSDVLPPQWAENLGMASRAERNRRPAPVRPSLAGTAPDPPEPQR